MPCVEKTPKDINLALQILDAATPRESINRDMDSPAIREITQTDHINKHLLQIFLQRLNVMPEVPINNTDEDENFQEFDD